jgi:hypothetical protein
VTGVTTGVIAFLGAVLGAVAGFLAVLAWLFGGRQPSVVSRQPLE